MGGHKRAARRNRTSPSADGAAVLFGAVVRAAAAAGLVTAGRPALWNTTMSSVMDAASTIGDVAAHVATVVFEHQEQ